MVLYDKCTHIMVFVLGKKQVYKQTNKNVLIDRFLVLNDFIRYKCILISRFIYSLSIDYIIYIIFTNIYIYIHLLYSMLLIYVVHWYIN